jgi:hypothetical protein
LRFLRQSTASQEILLGPFVDDTDGKTPETGLTIANTDIKLLVGGATTEADKNSGGGTHVAGGRYSAVLDATDTATVGVLEVSVNATGALPFTKSYFVMEATRYDSLYGSAANAPLFGDITHGTLQSATSSTAVLASATSIADDLINNVQLEITGGTGAGQQRVVTDWVSATDTATVSPNWTVTPDNTSTYIVRSMAPAPTAAGTLPSVSVGEWLGTAVATPTVAGVPEVDVTHAAGSAQTSIATQASVNTIDDLLDTEIAAIQSTLTTISGLVDDLETRLSATRAGYLDNLSAGAVAQAAALATISGLVDDLETRLSATRAGYLDNLSGGAVALASALATVSGLVDDLETRLSATRAGYLDNLSAGAVATAAALATVSGKVDAVDDYVDAEIAALVAALALVKAKTDQLTFGVANTLNVNITYTNEIEVKGSGTLIDPWGPV